MKIWFESCGWTPWWKTGIAPAKVAFFFEPPDSIKTLKDTKFNEKYDRELLEEQKTLLNLYIKSFVDNSLEFKIYLNEEIARLKTGIIEAKNQKEFTNDPEMLEKAAQVLNKLESFKETEINERLILSVLKIQSLHKETAQDASSN